MQGFGGRGSSVIVLNDQRKSVNGSNILVLAVTYKRDTNDLRESPTLDMIKILAGKGATGRFYDTHVTDLSNFEGALHVPLAKEVLRAADCVSIVTDYSNVHYEWVMAYAQCGEVCAYRGHESHQITRLGGGALAEEATAARNCMHASVCSRTAIALHAGYWKNPLALLF